MKKVSYGIVWVCVVLLICMAYYGSYKMSQKIEREHTAEERMQEQTQEVNGNGVYKYVLKEEHGEVQVYESDGKTLYERTGISVSTLPGKVQREVIRGKTVKDNSSLYSFLENYSS